MHLILKQTSKFAKLRLNYDRVIEMNTLFRGQVMNVLYVYMYL